ncbi:MAG: O-antigen ligase family protein [Hyphomicrobiaceae bacterium]|nr:hypothetical protein [Hyphomicrobiaceae bacterium]
MPRAVNYDPSVYPIAQHYSALAVAACFAVLTALYFDHSPLSIVAAAALPLALLISIQSPILVCVLFVSITFFRIHEAYPFLEPLKLPFAFGSLMFTSLALQWLVMGRIVPFWMPELRYLVGLFVLITIGVIFAKNRQVAWNFYSDVYWKIVLVTFAVAWITRTTDDFNKISRILVLSGIAIAAVAIYNKTYGIGLVEGTRVTIARKPRREELVGEFDPLESVSTLSDPNDLALILLFPLAFAISSLVYRSGVINTVLGLTGTVTTTLAIIFTQSRGGLLGILAILGVMGLRTIKSRTVVISLGVAAALGLAVAMGISSRVSGGAQEISESGIDDSSLGRIIAWRAAIAMAVARPLNGVGINNFIDSYHFFSEVPNRREKAVHSTWFQVLAETGFPGFIVFVTMLVITFKTAIVTLMRLSIAQAPPILTATALSLVAGLASFCAAGTFLTQAFTLPIYILIGLTVALSRASERHHNNQSLDDVSVPWHPTPPLRPIYRHLPTFGRQK